MHKVLLTSVAALFLATGTASAQISDSDPTWLREQFRQSEERARQRGYELEMDMKNLETQRKQRESEQRLDQLERRQQEQENRWRR
jgi:hypothetical protein